MQRQKTSRPSSKGVAPLERDVVKQSPPTEEGVTELLRMQQTLGNQVTRRWAVNSARIANGAAASSTVSAEETPESDEPDESFAPLESDVAPDEDVTPPDESDITETLDSPEPTTETAPPEGAAARPLVLEDSADAPERGQMRKTQFLSDLRSAVFSAAESALSGTEHSPDECPYIDYWFTYYGYQDSLHIERAIRRYAPETADATTAGEYIGMIGERVFRAVTLWSQTGEVTGVPDGVPSYMSGAKFGENRSGARSKRGLLLFKGRNGGAGNAADPLVVQSQLDSGRPLDSGVRSQMESAFGYSFSRVRVHTDAKAGELSNTLDARAFTVGEHVAFGAGEYKPGTLVGDALIAHELAHVVQQGGEVSPHAPLQKGGAGESSLEEDADQSAVGAVVSLWGKAKGGLANISKSAMPRLRSGLRLNRCGGKGKSTSSAKPTLSLSNDTYDDSTPATESHKRIQFDVAVPSGLTATDYALVNQLKGFQKAPSGHFFKVKMYGSTVDFNFPNWQVDSLDADPVYSSDSSGRWNYTVVPGGFFGSDDPGPALTSEHGAVYAVNFKIGLYKLSDVPTTTTGSISATPLEEKPWQYSVVVDSATGAFSHPAI
jgi:hypothetical protein